MRKTKSVKEMSHLSDLYPELWTLLKMSIIGVFFCFMTSNIEGFISKQKERHETKQLNNFSS